MLNPDRHEARRLPNDCERFSRLLEEKWDETPMPAEQTRWMNTHARDCRDCAALEHATSLLTDLPAGPQQDAAAPTRRVLAVVEQRAQRRRFIRQALAAGIAAVVVFASVWTATRGRWNRLEVSLVRGSVQPGASLAEQENLTAGAEGAALSLGSDITVYLPDATAVSVLRARRQEVHLSPRHGMLALRVAPGTRTHVVVTALAATVHVSGAVVLVDVTSGLQVDVVEGSVDIETGPGASRVRVANDASWRLGDQETTPLAPTRRAMILDLVEGRQPPTPAAASATGDKNASSALLRPSAGVRKPSALPSPSELLEMASKSQASRDWHAAAEAYRQLIEVHPRSAEAATVRVPLGDLELEHLDDPAGALRDYSAYLEAQPRGALAYEALYGKARALRTLSRVAEEQETLRTLLTKYPRGVHRAALEARLRELEGTR